MYGKQENSLDYTLNHFELIHGSDKERVRADMLHGKSGHFIFDLKGVQWYCHYNPVGYGGWYIFTMLRHDVGAAYASGDYIETYGCIRCDPHLLLDLCAADFAAAKRHTAALMRVAYYDELCQCPNLAKFKLDVQKFIDEHPGEGVLMTKFDIRQFKLLNKILGKEVGNTVLITIAGNPQKMPSAVNKIILHIKMILQK